jgi:hypothetical protein
MNQKEPEIHINNEGPVNKKGKLPSSSNPGLLGSFFGSPDNAPTSICGIVVVLLIIIGALTLFFKTSVDAAEFWKTIVLPAITALFGYLFGKGRR